MVKIVDLPAIDPDGSETVIVVRDGLTRRVALAPAVAAAAEPVLAQAQTDAVAALEGQAQEILAGTAKLADLQSTDTAAPGAARIGAKGGGTLQDHVDRTTFATVAALLASTIAPRGAGTVWRAGVFGYVEADSTAADHHLTTAGGVKLYAQPQGRTVWAEQFGAVADGVTNCLVQIQKAVSTGYDVIFEGALNIGNGVITPASANQTLKGGLLGSSILFSGSRAIYSRVAQGLTGPAMFSTFATNIKIQRLKFQRSTFSTSAQAIRMVNVRGLYVEDCEFSNCSLLYVTMEAEENGTYNRNNGSATVDPAVVAGWSATDTNDLNEHVYVRRNRGLNTRYGCQGVRLNWTRYFEVSDNSFPYGNISWWGGGAMQDQGGAAGFMRRVIKGRIKGNYVSWNNGGIYGNNGQDIVVANNTLEYSIDTALDFEGCFQCLAIGNTISSFGNFATSAFYASIGNAFVGNAINCTLIGASLSAMLGTTQYMGSGTISALTDNGDGTTTISVSGGTPDLQTGQLVLVPSLTGGANTPLAVTRVSSVSYKVPLPYSSSWTTGGDFFYQNGRTYFQVISGFLVDAQGSLQGETSFAQNTVVANDGLIGRCADGPHDTVTVSGNRLTNCLISLLSTSGGSKIVEGNTLKWKYAALPARAATGAGLIDVRGWAEHASISHNTIIAATPTQVVPAGGYAIYAGASRYAVGGMSAKIEGNVVRRYASATVAAGIYFSCENTNGTLGSSARIANNQVASITDASPAGACTVAYSGNIGMSGAALDKLTATPASGATVQMTGAGHTVYLNHAATIAALTLALPIDPADDAAYRIVARAAVTALTITNATTGAPSVYGTAPTALAAGQTVRVSYSASQNAWIWG